ncbi:serine/threonine-protein kinase [Streptomyces sp. MS1.HAVA.3]|uniref:Serine/threonine-protein kinase n=1 Tax=Streptomyces caledonius TaxID=3134107 RepID=A0ABU8UB86_9ACTN
MERSELSASEFAGPFRTVAVLGRGGMGRVVLGVGPDGRYVAVKQVHAELAEDEGFRARFRREVDASRRVAGGYTAAVIDADPDAEMPWLASQFVPGPSLSQAVDAAGPLPEEAVRRLAAGLAHALADVHRAGLIHRDLKPSNVLLAEDGVRVIDFGIVRAVGDQTRITHAGALIGSPAYMSPEQALGRELTRPPTCSRSARPSSWPARGSRRSSGARCRGSCTRSCTPNRSWVTYRAGCAGSSRTAWPRIRPTGRPPASCSARSASWRPRRGRGRRRCTRWSTSRSP